MRRRAAFLALALVALLAGKARASFEEFASLEVASIEEDDENALDFYLVRTPLAWRDEWEQTRAAFRSSEGCFTSGLWHTRHELKLRSPLGEHAVMDLGYQQVQTGEFSYEWLQFDFKLPTKNLGEFGWRFRPSYDKSQQDFALLWNHGDARSPIQIESAFTVEDMFNSLWEFRQARVGNRSEAYRIHPFEPSLRVVSRGAHHRYEVSGAWLTPSRKTIADPAAGLNGSSSLWGSKAFLLAEQSVGKWNAVTRLDMVQALSAQSAQGLPGDHHSFRRRWIGDLGVGRRLGARTHAEARWVYQERDQGWSPPVASARLHAIDRMPVVELQHETRRGWLLRGGAMYDRIGIDNQGLVPVFSWGSRKEARAFIGLQAQFGRVRVQGIECIELDREPYEVTFHHDKGFFHLQTTF